MLRKFSKKYKEKQKYRLNELRKDDRMKKEHLFVQFESQSGTII